MRRSRLRLDGARIGAVAIAILLHGAPAYAEAGGERDLLLEVFINGNDTQQVGTFHEKGGRLFVDTQELQAFGLVPPPSAAPGASVALDSLAGVEVKVNEREQTLSLRVPVRALAGHSIGGKVDQAQDAGPSPLGLLANYDVTATTQSGSVGFSGLGSARLFGQFGTLDSSFSLAGDRSQVRAMRLQTTYSFSDQARMRTYSAGDVVSGSLPYSRSLRLGGVQLSTNFSLRPDLVTYPLPVIGGGATVPSTVDVLVNGVRQLSAPVAAGPFTIPQLPMVTGAGQVSVAVRDATGRQSVQTSSFYVSSALLRPGLSSLSLEAGAIRRNFGIESNDYGPLAMEATGRHGLTSSLTVEGHGEVSGRLALASGGATIEVAKLAVVSAGLGISRSGGGTGGQSYASIEHTGPTYHFGASLLTRTGRFRDLGTLAGDMPPKHILQVNAGVVLGRLGSLGVAYTDVSQPAARIITPWGMQPAPAVRTSLLTATYSRELFGRAYLYVTGYRDMRQPHAGAVSAGISFRFGGGKSASASYDSSTGQTTFEASHPMQNPGDIGWRAYAARGASERLLGEVGYHGSHAVWNLGVDHSSGSTAVQINGRGSIVALGGAVYASDVINDGFALVDTQGVGNVGVTLNNRPVGRTGANGKLLVSGLVSYQPNAIAIDPNDLPLDAQWTRLDTSIIPSRGAGVVARFQVQRQHQVLATIRLENGTPLPVGSRIILDDGDQVAEVGFDGQAYFADLRGRHHMMAAMPDSTLCSAEIVAPETGSWPLSLQLTCGAFVKKRVRRDFAMNWP